MAKNPVDEFLEMKKEATSPATWGNFGQHFNHAAAGAAATGAVGLGIAGIGLAASKIVDAATKSHDYKAMLAQNPDLQEHANNDPNKFTAMFSTLRSMNPQFSKDPLVAGAFMRQMHESPHGIAGIASEALKHRRDFGDSMFDKAMPFAQSGAAAGVSESMKRRTPEEMLAQKRPEMDYSHRLQQERDATGHGLTGLSLKMKAEEMAQRDRHHGANMADNSRRDALQRQFQHALATMDEHTEDTSETEGGQHGPTRTTRNVFKTRTR